MPSPFEVRVARALRERPRHALDPSLDPEEASEKAAAVRAFVRRAIDRAAASPLVGEPGPASVQGELEMRGYAFRAGDGASFSGTLVGPAAGAAARGVIAIIPGRNARHAQVIGAEPPDYPDRNIAQRLAGAGFATLTLDLGVLGSLDPMKLAGRDETSLLAHALALQGQSPLAHMCADLVEILAWIEAQPWCEPGRVGLLGHSLGGHVALHAALAWHKPIPLVLASCLSTYPAIFGRDLSGGGALTLPGVLRHADFPDLVAALAPAPLQIQHGELDREFPLDTALPAISRVEASFDRCRARDALDVAILPMGHGADAGRAASFFGDAFASDRSMPTPETVPPFRVHFSAEARAEALDRIDQAMFSGALTLGPVGRAFEDLARTWTGTPHVAAVSSGTSAIEIAARVVGVAGRRVLIPANTFFATASAVMAAGARVGFVDIEPDGLGMDLGRLGEALAGDNDVAAVVVVHIGGLISPLIDEIASICDRSGIALIEDAAHALGSTLDGRAAGSFGRLAAFSLYPTKIVTSGEGGLVATRSDADDDLVRRLRDHGKIDFTTNIHDRIGSNWRMSEPHAAIGLAHLARLESFIEERRAAATRYDRALAHLPFIKAMAQRPGAGNNYYKYIALLDASIDRSALKLALRERHGVVLSGEIYDPLCSLQPALGGQFDDEEMPVASAFSRRHICLPIFQGLTPAQQDRIVEALDEELQLPALVAQAEGARQ